MKIEGCMRYQSLVAMREKLGVGDGSREMNVHDQIVTMDVGKTFAENNCV
jgi:hypothetical protein